MAAHNISPHGDIEGAMIECDGKTVQVNFPRHEEADLAARFRVDDTVELLVEPHDSEGEHPVFVASGNLSRVEGVVSALNFTRHGEVNGYRLGDGKLIHVKPHGARRIKVAIGDRIAAEGVLRVGTHATVLDAEGVEKLAGRKK
ncbi:MAG TPA: hypothetical protein VFP84_25635 [Kofleriaceae bacterium]|nr:hypothetical protein [Kofleriaceae bacterium]